MKKRKVKQKVSNIKGFAIQFMPHTEIRGLESGARVKKVLDVVLSNNILILQGKLEAGEESRLIEDTMAMIGHVKNFKGIELAVISGNHHGSVWRKMKGRMANALMGGDIGAVTIIGPATVVKEIKRNPKKIELFLNK